jgi:hypothetical protein
VTKNGQTVVPNGTYQAGYYLNGTTVHDNGFADRLEGGDLAWYFASLDDQIVRQRRDEVVRRIL